MDKRYITGKLVDELIRFAALGAVVSTVVLAPNAIQALDKPLRALDRKLTKREREREARRIIRYMKERGYLAGSYEHGLQLTDKARRRLSKNAMHATHIRIPSVWDGNWRIVLYDIPESKGSARRALGDMLRTLGCFQLQKSAWITPFACRDQIASIAAYFDVDSYITYLEAQHLDNEKVMIKKFQRKYPCTKFSRKISNHSYKF